MPKPNGELSLREINRQDFVDNQIYELLCTLDTDPNEIEWNIELIAKIRDVVQEVLVDDLGLIMTEQEFYPYLGYDAVENPDYRPDNTEMIITDEQLVIAMKQVIEDIDADDLGVLAGDWLGGLCWYTNDGLYSFIPDERYSGGLDFTKELNGN